MGEYNLKYPDVKCRTCGSWHYGCSTDVCPEGVKRDLRSKLKRVSNLSSSDVELDEILRDIDIENVDLLRLPPKMTRELCHRLKLCMEEKKRLEDELFSRKLLWLAIDTRSDALVGFGNHSEAQLCANEHEAECGHRTVIRLIKCGFLIKGYR